MNLKLYLTFAVLLGGLSALADWHFKTPNMVAYASGGTGLFGGMAYALMLILGKWVD